MDPAETSVVILCGGRGTRLQERTRSIPKPLVEIGGRPIVAHVIDIYVAQGFERFLLCTGYKGELIERFVADEPWPTGVRVDCLDTGIDTPTGGRVLHAARRLAYGGSAYDDRVIKARLAQAFGRLIRRQDDRGVFVILSAAMPSRLLSAFPPQVRVSRVPLDSAIERVRERLASSEKAVTKCEA